MPLESDKKELVLGINVFDKPTELIGPKAWAQLLVNLCFLRPGTYPSQPMMGIGIQDYEYEFIDAAIERLQEEIPAQARQYLPDVPLESVEVKSTIVNGRDILIIIFNMYYRNTIVSAAVAADVSNKIIDFDISWAN